MSNNAVITNLGEVVSPVIIKLAVGFTVGKGGDAFLAAADQVMDRAEGTAGDGHDEARAWMAVDWLVREYTPAWVGLAGCNTHNLTGLCPIVDLASAEAARDALDRAYADCAWARSHHQKPARAWWARRTWDDMLPDAMREGNAWDAGSAATSAAWYITDATRGLFNVPGGAKDTARKTRDEAVAAAQACTDPGARHGLVVNAAAAIKANSVPTIAELAARAVRTAAAAAHTRASETDLAECVTTTARSGMDLLDRMVDRTEARGRFGAAQDGSLRAVHG